MQNQMRRCFVIVSVFVFLIGAFFITPAPLFAKAMSVTTEIRHTPIDFFVPAKRIQLDATVTDKHAVKLVRCYFKADAQAEYVFVKMERIDKNSYRAILPAPADNTGRIEYLFLAVNISNQVVKTQTFTVNKGGKNEDVPDWQEVSAVGVIAVYTELSKAPETVSGFSDSITMDAVESSARFGMVVGGIYSASALASSGGAAGTAAAATSGGAITATGGGLSTAAIVGITAGGLAAAGGVAATAGGGGGGGSNDNPNASITWSDLECGVSLRVVFAGKEKGISQAGEPIEVKGLPVGDHELVIYNEAGTEGGGCGDGISFYTIILGGGATFKDDGSTQKDGELQAGGSRSYQVHVPETGSATFQW